MLILVAVTISMAVNGGLFEYAGKATGDTQNEIDAEQILANGKIKVENTWYDSIDDYLNNIPSGTQSGGTADGDGAEEGTGGNGEVTEPSEEKTLVTTFSIGKDNPDDVIAYLYLKNNGNYDVEIKGTGEIQSFGDATWCSPTYDGNNPLSGYKIERAYIEDGVTSISNTLFARQSLLVDVELPNSITEIGEGSFYDCKGLTSITIPDKVTRIGNLAFKGCRSLEAVEIPEGVTSLGTQAFSGCYGLTYINVPDSVIEVRNLCL